MSTVENKPAAPHGYTVCRTSIEFRSLNVGDTFVHEDAHMRKVDDHYAVIVAGALGARYPMTTTREVWQTFDLVKAACAWSSPTLNSADSEISESEPQFEAGQSIRLTILPGIDHEAEIQRYHQDNLWRVGAKINGQLFYFIVSEDQIVTMQRYLVTGISRLGVTNGGSFAFTPQAVIVEAHDAMKARELAKSLHNDYYQIVTCMRMTHSFEPEFYDDNGEAAFY